MADRLDYLVVIIAAAAANSLPNLAVKSERDASTAELDVVEETPSKPKCKSLYYV